jgi:hypothetical protein
MVVDKFPDFLTWLPTAGFVFVLLLLAGGLIGIFFGYLVAAFRHGPFEAFYVVAQVVAGAIPDFLGTSPRRIHAIAGLAIKEAIRRKVVLVTFGVFAIALLFGGWFMNAGVDNPDRVYVNFVLWGTQLLVLFMGMLISAFSLPDDIKNKTIYTIVTKPVRATEIVVGRIVGFGLLGTVLLVLMGLLSFLFVWRGLSHSHQVVGTQDIAALSEIDPTTRRSARGGRVSDNALQEGLSTTDSSHDHSIELIEDVRSANDPLPDNENNIVSKTVRADGKIVYQVVIVNPAAGHTHEATVAKSTSGGADRLTLGPANGYFRARVPIYAETLTFFDGEGSLSMGGTDVGKEWSYRGFVDGGTTSRPNSLSRAEFIFQDISPEKFRDNSRIALEMTLSAFRTFKGDIEQRVTGSLQFESVPDNPEAEATIKSEVMLFETNEYTVQILPVPRKLPGKKIGPDGTVREEADFDLFADFASDKAHRIKLILRCEDRNQYLGVARGDVYLRAGDDLYWWNFIKGYMGIWSQMMVVIALGVAFSTFLSAPIAVIGTIVMILIGFSTTFIKDLTNVEASGGGPVESFWRLVTQKNMETPLEPGIPRTLLEQADYLLVNMLNSLTYLAPDFRDLNFSSFLTYGYSVDSSRLGVAVMISLSFCFGLSVLGYFCLKTREIAK